MGSMDSMQFLIKAALADHSSKQSSAHTFNFNNTIALIWENWLCGQLPMHGKEVFLGTPVSVLQPSLTS